MSGFLMFSGTSLNCHPPASQRARKTTIRKLHGVALSQTGASLVELAVFLPILIIFFFGLVEFGRLVREMTWVNQTAFQTALLGGENSPTLGIGIMDRRVTDLTDIQGKSLKRELNLATAYDTSAGSRTVSVSLGGEINKILNSPYELAMNVVQVAPLLMNAAVIANGSATFSDPVCPHACNGTKCCGCSIEPNCAYDSYPIDPGPGRAAPSGEGGDGNGTGTCFLAGTPILMADGRTKPIEEMREGEHVRSYDEASKSFVNALVESAFKKISPEYLVINGEIKLTPEHPMLLRAAHTWVKAGALQVGDELMREGGGAYSITSIVHKQESVPVFNMTIKDTHTYIAHGVVTHNISPVKDRCDNG